MGADPERDDVERVEGGFCRILRIAASRAGQHPDALGRIRSGDLQAVVVDGVYDEATLKRVVGRLERHDPPFLRTAFPAPFRSWFYGRNLNLSEPDLSGYFDESALFNAQLDGLFEPAPSIRARVPALLSHLDVGRPVVAAPGPEAGQRYMFTTLRAHEEGGYIPPHFDNEQAMRPAYRHLNRLVRPHLISFVLALTRADGGGAHQVYDCALEAGATEFLNDDGVADRPDTAQLRSVSLRLAPGSLLVADSGRFLHRVSPVEGPRRRWTACSFMALDRAGETLLAWG